MAPSWEQLGEEVAAVTEEWRADRSARLARRGLDAGEFARLAGAGWLQVAVPEEDGGLWRGVAQTVTPACELVRELARADPSVALVETMHPSVLAFWLARPDPGRPAWAEQSEAVTATAAAGAQWGTITSEPGSGGDILKTRTVARPDDDAGGFLPGAGYRLTGQKHFGSGSGVCDFMITTAVAEGEDVPSAYVIDMRDRPWDGTAGLRLTAEWDGVGMAATQSHAMALEDCPAVRFSWDGPLGDLTMAAGPMISPLFTAVIVGILDEAVAVAREQLAPKADGLRAFERVEWVRADLDHWTAVQAYEGALRTIAAGEGVEALRAAVRAKEAVADLAESCLSRLARVVGGGAFSRRSPFAAWYEDVRALGFLRPPWGLAYDNLFQASFL